MKTVSYIGPGAREPTRVGANKTIRRKGLFKRNVLSLE